MSSKEGTPAKSDAASSTANPVEKESQLNPRQEELFKIAMLYCLKSGAPEIDIDKFVTHGNFAAKKTAQNTWGKIKNKVFLKVEEAAGEEAADGGMY